MKIKTTLTTIQALEIKMNLYLKLYEVYDNMKYTSRSKVHHSFRNIVSFTHNEYVYQVEIERCGYGTLITITTKDNVDINDIAEPLIKYLEKYDCD